ncbi:hypothetical protein P782_0641 [Enterococcus faecalis FL2]|nr:hypothetical protein P782_0641 [Enterococcus faecalis FL2]
MFVIKPKVKYLAKKRAKKIKINEKKLCSLKNKKPHAE